MSRRVVALEAAFIAQAAVRDYWQRRARRAPSTANEKRACFAERRLNLLRSQLCAARAEAGLQELPL